MQRLIYFVIPSEAVLREVEESVVEKTDPSTNSG